MPILTGRMTAKTFLDLPGDPNKTRYELVHGEVVVSPAPNLDHAYVVARLITLLVTHVRDRNLGEVFSDIDTYFGPNDVRRPDVLFFTSARSAHLRGRYPDAPPDLCVEVLSPSNANFDRTDKFNLYQDSGVPYYWIVDPMQRTFESFALASGRYVNASQGADNDVVRPAPFPDLDIRLAELWRPLFGAQDK